MTRDLAIDATRGVAIWSMITAHFALGMRIAEPTHAFPYVDGMSAFVLLSGFVLGLVYQRWIERHGLRFAYRRLTKRIVVLYVCQLTIALVAVAAAMAGHRWLTLLLPIDGWLDGIRSALAMDYLPSGGNILLLYMVLMASAYVVFPLLMRGWWVFVLVTSAALYVLAQIHSPGWFFLTQSMASPRTENWAAWQIMFVPAVVVGWNWRRWHGARFIDKYLVAIVAGAVCVWVVFHYVIDTGPWAEFEPHFADKVSFAPARALGAWVVVPALYGIFRALLRVWHHDWLRPLVMTGARSLDSYVIQAIALIIVPIHIAHRPWAETTAVAATLLVFGACWAWAEFRRVVGIDKLHRIPTIAYRATRIPAAPPSDGSAAPNSEREPVSEAVPG
ncbi:OpgC domain-containing protein [Gordonia aichiensis]|nr:OpgC domain-containing protein [Gordonia aichiensis]